MLQIHPNARTTPVTRAEIAGSHERSGVLAHRCGVSTETIRKWRKRGVADCLRWSPEFGQRAKLGSLLRRTDLDDEQTEAVFGGFQGEGCA
jgi:hypothetical protein